MRFLLLILFGLSFTIGLQAQNPSIEKFFETYRDDDRFTQVNISPKMFEMFAQMDDEMEMDEDLKQMIASIKGLKILTTDSTPNHFYDEFTKKVALNTYEELMTVRDGDSNVKFLVKDSDGGNVVNELVLLVGGSEDFVLMSFSGQIPLDKIGKLASSLNFSGSEHLDKLNK